MKVKNHENKLVSVIIPVYGTEKLLPRCLDSIINQTYKNLEIIVVNDCSPGNCADIVREYKSIDNRIKYVEHDENKGLFLARISGAKIARGDYIAFVDSDDYIAIDLYRLLVKAAVDYQADMVSTNIIMVSEVDNHHYIHPLNRPTTAVLEGTEILDAYFDQEGQSFHWHAVWNKLYSRNLWDKAFPHYLLLNKHLIMTEDFVYSTVLFYYSQRYASIDYEGYYYYQNANASTSLSGNITKFIKNIEDLGVAFKFVEQFLISENKYEVYKNKFNAWKERYSRFWMDNVQNSRLSSIEKKQAINKLKEAFGVDELNNSISADHYFYSISVTWDGRYEHLKTEINKDDYEYISFDIFDTLIVRPFADPRDLFRLLDFEYEKYSINKVIDKFSTIRVMAEEQVRREIVYNYVQYEDITLDEIYEYIISHYGVERAVAQKMKEREIELELKFCEPRRSAKELFEMAQTIGKKIVIITDMYLPREVIEKILAANGYSVYHKLYLSSELRLSKHHGTIFKHVLKDLGCEGSRILHIGDNWESDVVNPQKYGYSTYFYPKAISRFFNHIPDKETGNSTFLYFHPNGRWNNYQYAKDYLLISCMMAEIANYYFDNPYRSFAEYSDFNCDPCYLGYYAVGMHSFAIAKWIIEDAIKKGYRKIHFLSRDGYLVKKVYDQLSACYKDSPKSSYFYASRKSMIPALIDSYSTLYMLDRFVNIKAFSPQKVFKLIFRKELSKDIEAALLNKGFLANKQFTDTHEFHKFVAVLKELGTDFSMNAEYRKTAQRYVEKEVGEKEALFDIGYSGTIQMAMAAMGGKTDAYYVHVNKDTAHVYASKLGFQVNTFYSYSPSISGTLREYIFSETGPSCIGYREVNGEVLPVFENNNFSYIEKFIINNIHKAAEEFTRNIVKKFKEYIPDLFIRNDDASMPYEMFLHNAKAHDRRLFAECYFEDDTFHGKSRINLMNDWIQASDYHKTNFPIESCPGTIVNTDTSSVSYDYFFLNGRSRYAKALFYFLYNRDLFKDRVKSRLSHRPIMLKVCVISFRTIRLIKRLLVGPR